MRITLNATAKTTDPIKTFIFPEGMLPSITAFIQASCNSGLKVSDQFAFGKSYVLTLRHWLNNFMAKHSEIKALGFDEKFIRLWQFYLEFCIAGFATERTDVLQIELQHAN